MNSWHKTDMKSIERGQRQGGWVTNKFVLSKLISFAAADDDFEDENQNEYCDYHCQKYYHWWRKHCAIQWLHCLHCLYCLHCLHCWTLFSLPELIFVATGGRNFFPGAVMFSEKKLKIMCSSWVIYPLSDSVKLGTYCENLCTYSVRFCTNVEINS